MDEGKQKKQKKTIFFKEKLMKLLLSFDPNHYNKLPNNSQQKETKTQRKNLDSSFPEALVLLNAHHYKLPNKSQKKGTKTKRKNIDERKKKKWKKEDETVLIFC